MRKKLVAGNWKMNKTDPEAIALAGALRDGLRGAIKVDVVLCPPFTSLKSVCEAVKGGPMAVGGQNMGWEKAGAYTGEVSPDMLLTIGVRYVILGHSERRQYLSESDRLIGRKCQLALTTGLIPIVCVGEQLADREAGRTESVVAGQLDGFLAEVDSALIGKIVVAYEPVWAIGTGKTATPQMAVEVHRLIRSRWAQKFGWDAANNLRILYGGSVNSKNAGELLRESEIDGALVGGASLEAAQFLQIISSVL